MMNSGSTVLLVEDVLDEELDADEINDILEGRMDCLLQFKRIFRHTPLKIAFPSGGSAL
jgi:hypothetical protein